MCFNHYIGVIIALFDPLFESVAFFYIPDPLREPPCVQKKVTCLQNRPSRASTPVKSLSGAFRDAFLDFSPNSRPEP